MRLQHARLGAIGEVEGARVARPAAAGAALAQHDLQDAEPRLRVEGEDLPPVLIAASSCAFVM